MTRLASQEMASLWTRATGTLLHGPRCTCMSFGVMHRSRADLERDIAEFLIAKYEDQKRAGLARLFEYWVDEHDDRPGSGDAKSAAQEGLPEWIDRYAPSMNISDDDLNQVATDIRDLLESMTTSSGQFVCR